MHYIRRMEQVKTCAKCEKLLPVSMFYKGKRTRDGLGSSCKTCHGLQTAAARLKRTAAAREKLRADRIQFKQDVRLAMRDIATHNKKRSESKQQPSAPSYYERNKEKIKAQSKAWKESNREKANAQSKRWRSKNRDLYKQIQASVAARRKAVTKELRAAQKAVKETERRKLLAARAALKEQQQKAAPEKLKALRRRPAENLTDNYVVHTIREAAPGKVARSSIPPELIEAKRWYLKVQRLLKEKP